VKKTPNPGSLFDQLSGVSCATAKSCIAVGEFAPDSNFATTAEAWNGSKWAVQPALNPIGATSSQLNAVSCTAANSCVAVGEYTYASTVLTLAEAWNGSTWSVQPTPNPSGATSTELDGVSCTGADACVAVGTYGMSLHPYLTLAELWNGVSWTIQSTPDPGSANELASVSCTAADVCVAVGFGGSASALVEEWNGSVWSLMSTPPVADSLSGLLGVSCTAANACTAAGSYENGSDIYLTLAEAWNGSTWSIQATPSPTDNSYLNDVSCTATNACVAVGYDYTTGNPSAPLSEVWNGATWAIKSTPGTYTLAGTWCAAADTCVAVGESSDGLALAEIWNGTKWAIKSPPDPSADSVLNAVSCSAAGACVAVGYDQDFVPVTLAEVWNGSKWAIQSTPNPGGATTSDLIGVSCTAADACMAVGIYFDGSGYQTLAEVWNGATWAIVPTPDPSSIDSELDAVSCTAANACVAVGSYESSSSGPIVPLAEVWNGTGWAVQTTPDPSSSTLSQLLGVSCTAAKACLAVGSNFTSSGDTLTLAEVWNGTTWAIQSTPNPSGATTSELLAVSCTAAKACVAVGSYLASSGDTLTLAEVWNGTTWAIQSTPNPSGATTSELLAVSCTAAKACVSVGNQQGGSGDQLTLGEAWNGSKWTVESTPNPSGATYSNLSGASCAGATCAAVGTYDNIAGVNLTLAASEG
jgi:hypothetical protein